jgi:hypothetical protein
MTACPDYKELPKSKMDVAAEKEPVPLQTIQEPQPVVQVGLAYF